MTLFDIVQETEVEMSLNLMFHNPVNAKTLATQLEPTVSTVNQSLVDLSVKCNLLLDAYYNISNYVLSIDRQSESTTTT